MYCQLEILFKRVINTSEITKSSKRLIHSSLVKSFKFFRDFSSILNCKLGNYLVENFNQFTVIAVYTRHEKVANVVN